MKTNPNDLAIPMNPKKLEEMGRIYFGSDRYDYSGEFSGFKENFEAGVKSALNLPEVKELFQESKNMSIWLRRMSELKWSDAEYAPNFKKAHERLSKALADLEEVVSGV